MSLVIFVDHLKYHRQREVDADRFAVDLLMNEELPDYKVVLAIVLFPVSYTLRVLVRQFQCQVCLDFISRYSSTVICTVTIALLPHSCLLIITDLNEFHIIKAMSIRELTWQIKQVVLEAQNFTSILPSLRIFSLKTYEISDL